MFQILYNEKPIGVSALEDGDPPMGCAEGGFIPLQAFYEFSARIPPQPEGDPAIKRWTGLSVRTDDGTEVKCLDAVLFEYDFGDEKALRVDVLGIPNPLYEELFPGRYAAYEAGIIDEST